MTLGMTHRDLRDLDLETMTNRSSRYMRMEEEARTAIKVRARERYHQNIEEQRMKRYLNALRKGLVPCCAAEHPPRDLQHEAHPVHPDESGTCRSGTARSPHGRREGVA